MNIQTAKSVAYQSTNPATGKVLKSFESLTDNELEAKIAAAETCFETWRRKTYAERAVIVAKAAALLHAKANEFAHTMTLEMGKRIGEALGEVEFSSNILVLLRQERRTLFGAGEASSDPRRGPHGEQPDSAWCSAWSRGIFLTISLLGSPVRI